MNFRHYLRNCFWLLAPVLLLDAALGDALPEPFRMATFWRDIPAAIAWPEAVLRIVVIALPLLMPLAVRTTRQRAGIALYVVGLVAYGASWGLLILAPDSALAAMPVAYLAPAYTPLLWLGGIGLIGDRLFVPGVPYRWWVYVALSVLFVAVHVGHTALVAARFA